MARVFQLKSAPAALSRLGVDYAAALNDEQRAVVLAPRGPLLVLAGAGSGKTRALTYRVARFIDEGIAPERVLLLTFTNRAARAMLDRVAALVGPASQRVMGGTFHHVANTILRGHAESIGYAPNFTILDREDARDLMDAAVADARINVTKERFPKADVLIELASLAINTQVPARELVLRRAPRFLHLSDQLMAVCQAFIKRKVERNLMDFDDLLMNWKLLLAEGGPLADSIRGRFEAVLVDEYQDTNALQGQIVDLMGQGHKNITAVGDDAQCIYGFRGAEVKNMLGFAERWPGAVLLPLSVNYRSTPQVLEVANAVLARAREGFKTRLVGVRPSGALPAVVPCKDAHQQAEFVAERILQLRDEGVSLAEIGVLYRAHRHVLELQVGLTRRGIPYVVRSGLRFFEQAHIKDVVAHLKLLFNADDELSFRRAVRLHEGIGNATCDALWRRTKEHVAHGEDAARAIARLLDDEELSQGAVGRRAKPGVTRFVHTLGAMTKPDVKDKPGEMIRVLLDSFYAEYLARSEPNARERQEEIEELADFAAGFADLEAFLSELMLVQSFAAEEVVAADEPDEKVTLSSVHQAKGLEWSRVFLVWLADGAFPSDLALKDAGGEDEERRLFYVAVTRAKDELYLTHPLVTRARDQSMVLHRRSRFVEELPAPELDAAGEASGLYETWQIEVVPADPAALPKPDDVELLEGRPADDVGDRLLDD
ncbi:MAG: ATP-dependent helicase [Deltaproteobacteria bacterium]|nr:ATP-dependent helicase [Deltaproteobacteria bacterium]